MLYSLTKFGARLGIAAVLLLAQVCAAANDPDPNTEIWLKVKHSLFGDRSLMVDEAVLTLTTPYRAEDAATVPVAIAVRMAQSDDRYVQKLYLIIDKNPSPIAAVFTLTPESGRADIETRVRIEEYTHIRVIAELNNGELYSATRYIKAAGGCSAPAGKDVQAALARIGKMRFSVEKEPGGHGLLQAQLMISHPNFSGLAMDQLTRTYTPAHYVRSVNISFAGKPILSADVDFSISENPNFRFYLNAGAEGALRAEVVDNKDLRFESSMIIGGERVTQ